MKIEIIFPSVDTASLLHLPQPIQFSNYTRLKRSKEVAILLKLFFTVFEMLVHFFSSLISKLILVIDTNSNSLKSEMQ